MRVDWCRWCRGVIATDPTDERLVFFAVVRHRATARHQAYLRRREAWA